MKIGKVIYRPIITEKSVAASDKGVYVFKVHTQASKGAIKNEIESKFNVNVEDVKTMIVSGKPKRILRTRKFTKTAKWKKALVKLADGQQIKLFEEQK